MNMEETDPLPKNSCWSYCFSCLSKNDKVELYSYQLQNEPLKAILQADCIVLCSVCKETAKKAEAFIQNVQNTQISLEKNSLQDGNNLDEDDIVSVCNNFATIGRDGVKMEVKYDSEEDGNFTEFGDRIKIKIEEIKEEDEEHSIKLSNNQESEFKEPMRSNRNVKIKSKLKTPQKREFKRKSQPQEKVKSPTKKKIEKQDSDIPEGKIKLVDLTLEECLQERSQRRSKETYIDSIYKCEDCIIGFTYKACYEKHMETHNKSNGNYICNICKQRTSTEDKLRLHKRYHFKKYKCLECGTTRARKSNIQDHYRIKHSNSAELQFCSQCNKSFRRKTALKYHISNKHQKEKVKCDICNKAFAFKATLKNHMRRHTNETNEGVKRYICQVCGMAFAAPSILKYHSIKHSDRRDYYCVECDKSFKSEQVLKLHLSLAKPHRNPHDLRFPCHQCEQRFATRRNLDRHVNKDHLKIKPHQCDQCEKAYLNKWALNDHYRLVHDGLKLPLKYSCSICDKAFAAYLNKLDLNKHYRLVHEGLKLPLKYCCTICDKAFAKNYVLKEHIRTHTGERPYQCSQCSATFTQTGVLKTHVKMVHLNLTRDGRPKTGFESMSSTSI